MTDVLHDRDGRALLKLARDSIRCHLEGRALPEIRDPEESLSGSRGVFVTLTRAGTLRGCLGRVERSVPLWRGVREMAVAAATRDRRFEPVRLHELASLTLEISVLSELSAAGGPEAIRIGTHGIYLRRDDRTGLLLPQVAVEHAWGPQQFLERTCRKAGLPEGAWKEGTDIFVFSCQIFEEPGPEPRDAAR